MDQAFYNNESTFYFEIYATCLKHAFDTLRKYNQPKSDREEVKILLKYINKNNTQLTACIQICCQSYSVFISYFSASRKALISGPKILLGGRTDSKTDVCPAT